MGNIIFLILFLNYSNCYNTTYLSVLGCVPIINTIPDSKLQVITGNLWGDGSISLSKVNRGYGKYSLTMDVYSLNYLNHLDPEVYSHFTDTKLYPYPNVLLQDQTEKK